MNRGERRGTHTGLHRLDGDRVAVQVVGRDDLEAVRGKVVSEQLCSQVSQPGSRGGWGGVHLVVAEGDAEDVGEEEEDLVLRVLARGGRDVALDPADLFDLACARASALGDRVVSTKRTGRRALVLDTLDTVLAEAHDGGVVVGVVGVWRKNTAGSLPARSYLYPR
jgi:hypothetical protein